MGPNAYSGKLDQGLMFPTPRLYWLHNFLEGHYQYLIWIAYDIATEK
jgi:hypothetical protein